MRTLLLLTCFFLSGVAGLVYEVCWVRKASLVFGSTTYALSSVLAVFFLGIAFGSWFFGRRSVRSHRPLRLYAVLEIGVALLALAGPSLFQLVDDLYGIAYRKYSEDLGPLFLVRFVLVALVLFPPTFLMGGTLPLFVRQFVVKESRVAAPVGLLYALNTLGAALGCAVTGLRLIPTVGVDGSLRIGAILSVVAGVVTFAWAPRFVRSTPATEPDARDRGNVGVRGIGAFVLSALFFTTGFVALAAQVLWTRHLALLIRTTVVTYTITLTVVLVGIVLGSLIAAALFDRAAKWRGLVFGALQVLSGLSLLFVMLLPPEAWRSFASLLGASLGSGLAPYFLLLLPPAIFSGATFPLAVRMVVSDAALAGLGVGRMTAINTLGGVAGSLTLGFAVLPRFGLQNGLRLTSGIAVASGIVAWWLLRGRASRALVGGLTVAAAAGWIVAPRILETRLPVDFLTTQGRVVGFREGLAANVAVVEADDVRRLEIDRWWQGDERKGHQIMAAHVPMILHPSPKDVLVVGAGVGQTASRFLFYDIRRLDVVDLEPAVFDIVREHFDSAWMHDPRVRLIREDGRNYLSHTSRRYDVISLEAGQIFRPGVAAFYTTDFYERAAQRLAPGGILAQFVPLAFLTEEQFRGIVRTLRETFPEAVLWYNTSELLLLGRQSEGIEIRSSRLALLGAPPLADDLRYAHWGGAHQWLRRPGVFLGGFVSGRVGLSRLVKDAPIYRDDVPILEYATADAAEDEMRELAVLDVLRPCVDPISTAVEPNTAADVLAEANETRRCNLDDIVTAAHVRRVAALRSRGDLAGIRDVLDEALKHNASNLEAQRLMGDVQAQLGDLSSALTHYGDALRIDEADARTHRGLAIVLHVSGHPQDAIPHYRVALQGRPEDHELWNGLGGALMQTGALSEAAEALQESLRLRPEFAPAKANLERVRIAMEPTRR